MRWGVELVKRKGVTTRPILVALLGLAAIALVPYCIMVLLLPAWRAVERPIKRPGRVLLVTAHPDDETVFFGPTITALRSAGQEVFLLCLTTGNAHGRGHIRVKELEQAANALQIDSQHLSVKSDEAKLPDSKTADWDLAYAQSLVEAAVKQWSIQTIVTFDRGGVTGHKNHMSCWQIVRSYVADCKGTACPHAWSLLSTGKWRRYSLMFNVEPSSRGLQKARYLNHSIFKVFLAMYHHKTQWRWWSHVLFTRYTYANTLQQIDVGQPAVSVAAS